MIRHDGSAGRAIGIDAFESVDLRGKAVLVQTGWDAHWRTDQYFEGHPFLTRGAAEHLLQSGAALVGIDSLNIDAIDDRTRPVHSLLLGADIPIVEHLTRLDELPTDGFRFFAVPVKVKGMGTFRFELLGFGNESSETEPSPVVYRSREMQDKPEILASQHASRARRAFSFAVW